MKGKTGKKAMRGGGLARKGVGMALKGGGIARKGTGSNATPGGKFKKMAVGGPTTPTPAPAAAAPRPATTPAPAPAAAAPRPATTPAPAPAAAAPTPDRDRQRGGFGGLLNRPESSWSARSNAGVYDRAAAELQRRRFDADRDSFVRRHDDKRMTPPLTGGPATPTTPAATAPAATSPTVARKNGGKVAKYAKGGHVKMTAGSGSGSGRLEKVAAHKAAPRVKAVGLKKGGKVKLGAEELREFKGGKYMGGPKEEAAEKKKGKK